MAAKTILQRGVLFSRAAVRQQLPAGFSPATLQLDGGRPKPLELESVEAVMPRYQYSTPPFMRHEIVQSSSTSSTTRYAGAHPNPQKLATKAALYGFVIAFSGCLALLGLGSLLGLGRRRRSS
eukprot:scpid106637/ scgid5773/ 